MDSAATATPTSSRASTSQSFFFSFFFFFFHRNNSSVARSSRSLPSLYDLDISKNPLVDRSTPEPALMSPYLSIPPSHCNGPQCLVKNCHQAGCFNRLSPGLPTVTGAILTSLKYVTSKRDKDFIEAFTAVHANGGLGKRGVDGRLEHGMVIKGKSGAEEEVQTFGSF